MKGVFLLMKKTVKKLFCLVLCLALVFSLAGCAKINYVTNGTIQAIKEVKDGSWEEDDTEEETDSTTEDSSDDPVVIDEFVAGTYGGIEFSSLEDVVNYYVEAYNATKARTAEYIQEDGTTATFYELLGSEELTIGAVLVEGKENSVINSLVPSLVSSLFSSSTYGLPPCANRNPELDNNSEDELRSADYDFTTSMLTVDDVLAANVVDNGDGTITITIQPKGASMAEKGNDSQGRFFMALGDIGATVESISVLSWASGTTEENCVVTYSGGYGEVTINVDTGLVESAYYDMEVLIEVQHATVTVITDKSATVELSYIMEYPASDEYLLESKGLTRA